MPVPIFDDELLDLLPAAVYVCEAPSGVIKRYNRRAIELWGREPERGDTDERFRGSLRLFCPDGTCLSHNHSLVAEVLRDGLPALNREAIVERPDGSRLTVLANVVPIKDEHGVTVEAVNVFQDITERKQAEEALRVRARQQAAVADIGRRALEGTELAALMDEAVSLVAQALEVEHCKLLELLPDGQALRLLAGVGWRAGLVGRATVQAGRESQAGYTLLVQAPVIVEDLRRDTRFSGSPLLRDHGVVSGVSVIVRGPERPFGVLGAHTTRQRQFTRDDVSFLRAVANVLATAIHRQRAEAERSELLVREQAARAEAEAVRAEAEAAGRRAAFLAEASTILASSLDYEATLAAVARLAVPAFADYCIIDLLEVDQSLRRVATVHRDPAKAELTHRLRLYPPDLNGPHPIAAALRTGQPQLLPELPDVRLAGLARTPEHLAILRQLASRSLLSVPLVARGRTLGVLTFVAAESGRRYGPADQALAVDLARRAAVSIDNARLYQEARAAVRLRDDFLARASHELRTPLTSALGTVRLLTRAMAGTFKARPEELVDIANRNLSAMLTLVNSLLEASTLASGREPLELEPVDLATLVRQSVEVVGPQAQEKLVALRVAVPARLIVPADPLKLKQVLVNLLANAVKFTLAGGEVAVEAEAKAGAVLLRVRDTGMGIAHEHLEVIFEPFIQAGPPSRWRPHGTGMGLAICRQIITLHGGRIWAESEGSGRGSTFTVRLPAAPAATRAA